MLAEAVVGSIFVWVRVTIFSLITILASLSSLIIIATLYLLAIIYPSVIFAELIAEPKRLAECTSTPLGVPQVSTTADLTRSQDGPVPSTTSDAEYEQAEVLSPALALKSAALENYHDYRAFDGSPSFPLDPPSYPHMYERAAVRVNTRASRLNSNAKPFTPRKVLSVQALHTNTKAASILPRRSNLFNRTLSDLGDYYSSSAHALDQPFMIFRI